MAVIHSLYRESATVSIDPQTCRSCGECARICPVDVLEAIDGRVVVRPESPFGCIGCGHCMMICPHSSITVTGRGISPDDLLTLPPPETRATPESLAALMEARRSIRHFTTEEVAADVLDAIVEMAASGPMGVPPWDVGCVVVRGREKVQQLAGDIIRGYEGFLRRLGPWVLALLQPFAGRATHERVRHFVRPLAEMLVRQRKLGRDALFWGAPAAMIFHHSPYADRADAAIACTYAMLAAESLGLGTTMIGSAGPVLRRDPGLLRSWGIPEGSRPALVLILGYPAVQFRRTVRRHFTAVAQK